MEKDPTSGNHEDEARSDAGAPNIAETPHVSHFSRGSRRAFGGISRKGRPSLPIDLTAVREGAFPRTKPEKALDKVSAAKARIDAVRMHVLRLLTRSDDELHGYSWDNDDDHGIRGAALRHDGRITDGVLMHAENNPEN